MKILRTIYTLCAAALLCSSCQDEEMIKQSGVKEGIPVTIDLTFSAVIPKQETVGTRATTDPEYRVNDLYVLIFNKNTEALKGEVLSYDYSELNSTDPEGNKQNDGTGTLKSIETTTGESVIYAIANAGIAPSEYGTVEGAQSFEAKINAVQTIDDLKAINAKLHNNQTSNALERNGTTRRFLMSGSLDCTINADNTITVAGGGNANIPLYRTDSRIIFNIKAGGEGTNCTEFSLLSFQVCKVPSRTSLVPLNDGTNNLNYDTGNETDGDYWDTESGIQPNEQNKITFYVPENIKSPKDTSGDKTKYAYREAWTKGSKGERIFTNAPDNGTYVILHGIVEGTVDESTQVSDGTAVRAAVDYIIHLGDWSENDYSSFSNKRNVEYTYNITVNGVDNIVVEVETDQENEPGAEGDVFFQDGQYFDIDSHYESVVMTFASEEIHNTGVSDDYFTWRINSPFESTTADVVWLRFVKNDEDHANTVMPYPGDNDKSLMTLDDLMTELKRIRDDEPNGSLTVTCFIDEYVYDNEPDWSKYTNVRNREAYIFGEIKDSEDGNSSTIHTKYVISQRSIQTPDTYYAGLGLGIETLNETGDLPMGEPDNMPTDHATGRDNMISMLGNNLINVGTDSGWGYQPQSGNANEYEYSIPDNYKYAAYACLLRNRDEDGNGEITSDEIKWYLPAVDQYTAFYIGLNALSNDARFFTGNTYAYEHYFSSSWGNGENAPYIIWAEEGIGTQVFNGRDNYNDSGDLLTERKRNYRCIRNLGTGERTPFFEQDENNPLIITINHQRSEIYRDLMVDDNLGYHNERHANNQLYQRFQVAEDYLDRDGDNRRLEQPVADERNGVVSITSEGDTWDAKEVENVDPCSDYYEDRDQGDRGSWRMPNQRELLVMMTASGVTGSLQAKTAIFKMADFNQSSGTHQVMGKTTYSFYDGNSVNKYRYFVQSEVGDRVTGFIMQLQRDQEPDDTQEARQWRGFIRCVRDVE